MKDKSFSVSLSPHIHNGDRIEKKMYSVLLALLPAWLVSLLYFGLGALIISIVSVVACVLFEYLIGRFLLKEKSSVEDGSAALTGLLLALTLPSNLPVWIVLIGALVAIGIGKMSFGGLGNNIFNPALVGRVFLLISFPAHMTVWPEPGFFPMQYTDATTAATTLNMMKYQFGQLPDYLSLLTGNVGGSLGEVSAIALLIGGLLLLVRKIITWHIPVSILATLALFSWLLHAVAPQQYAPPLLHLLSGGLLLGAFFMATDYATSPMKFLWQK